MVLKYRDRITALEEDMEEVVQLEKEERMLRASENQVNKAARLLDKNAPPEGMERTWYQTHTERMREKGKRTRTYAHKHTCT